MGWPQIVFGVLLVAALLFLSLFYARRQVRALRELRLQSALSADEVRYEHAKAWRRLISCGLTFVLACLLAVALVFLEGPAEALAKAREGLAAGEALTPEQRDFARQYIWYWIVFLLVLLLVVMLAAIDLWSTRRYALREKRKLHADRRAMIERQVTRMREERGS